MVDALMVDEENDISEFIFSYYPYLYSFVFSRVGGPHEEIEEIVQETFLHAWKDRTRYKSESSLKTWISSIAKHRISERKRGRSRRERRESIARSLARIDSEEIPEDVLTGHELRAIVWDAMQLLRPEYSDLLNRRYMEGMTISEIAHQMGTSKKAIESRLSRAKEAFKRALSQGGTHGTR